MKLQRCVVTTILKLGHGTLLGNFILDECSQKFGVRSSHYLIDIFGWC